MRNQRYDPRSFMNQQSSGSEYRDRQFDDIKRWIGLSKLTGKDNKLTEQANPEYKEQTVDVTVDKKVQKEEKVREYRVSNGLIIVHGLTEGDLTLTDEEKGTFQETMDEFVEQVSDLTTYGSLNIYKNDISWSGTLDRFSLEYFYTIGESNGVYINAKMIKIDDDMMEILGKLKEYYNQFNAKWAAILAGRKVTEEGAEGESDTPEPSLEQ